MTKTICIVDDTPDLLKNLSEFLEMEGFRVIPFAKATDAIEYLDSSIPDLIITDLWMPALDGFVFIETIKANPRLERVPIMIFSAKAVAEYEQRARTLGVSNYMKKPSDLDHLLDEINHLLN